MCNVDGMREFIFRNDSVKQFVNLNNANNLLILITRTTKCFKKIICIAHNVKVFDAQFILKYLVENYGRTADNFKRDENYHDDSREH